MNDFDGSASPAIHGAVREAPARRRSAVRRLRIALRLGCLAGLIAAALAGSAAAQVPSTVVGGGGGGGQGFRRTVPTDYYFGVCTNLYDGQYTEALKEFQSCLRSAVKAGPNYWIDSICYHTMCGESYFQLGQYAPALDHYTKALQLASSHGNWMLSVNFNPAISPRQQASTQAVPWGVSQRQSLLGQFPDTVTIRQGQIDQSAVIQRGGVVQQAVDFPINPQEIVRCTCLALRRRGQVLGPMAAHDPLLKLMVSTLAKRPVSPNHWTEAWIDVELGSAFAALGNDAQARPLLEKSILTGGQFDHPLTSVALSELGRIALRAGDYELAIKYFQEASYSSFYFYDPIVCEESLSGAALAHLLANKPGIHPALPRAADWARKDIRHLQAALIASAAEKECLLERTPSAQTMLDNSRAIMVRNDIAKSRVGARLNFVQALASYQAGNTTAGDTAVNSALAFMQYGSLRLFHMSLAERWTLDRSLTPRMARDVFQSLLDDPKPADWSIEPLETLSSLVFPHLNYYERWLELSLESKERDGRRAVEIADLAKRHRFLSAQELGGRLLNLRWLLEGPTEGLSQTSALERQTLLQQFPGYEKLSQQARELRNQLAQLPLVSEDSSIAKQQSTKLTELDRISRQQEALLKVMAVRRTAAGLVFPPVRAVEDVQKGLPPQHALLTFFVGARGTIGFLMTNDKFGYWPIAVNGDVQKKLVAVLQGLGNFDENKVLTIADLSSESWRSASGELLDLLTKDSRANLPYGYTELIVVPDGYTWYVPFEALCASTQGGPSKPLLEQVRLRYAPTVGLAVGDVRPRLDQGKALVSVGRLYPGDDDEVAERAFDELARSLPSSEALRLRTHKAASGGALFASLADRLVVYSDVMASPAGLQGWSPLTGEKSSPGGTLADWQRLPWHGPEQIALPGFHTAAENGLKKIQAADAGRELFLATTGLMAAGARTVLISRWRPAGRTSYDLVREFMQEVPHVSAARAWQRSVLVARQTPIAPEAEPRIKLDSAQSAPPPDHPFFWGGYLMIDTGTEPATTASQAEAPAVATPPAGADADKAAVKKPPAS